ncbi:hypothetical protein M0802_000118 [Mischocyttarus mexicanus]|nr:hypothetical protein M0802_000118 [Mischocyttarus mexicanus]
MSFAKARIQRFNDLTNKVPPPGAYDPKFDPKVKGVAIEKKEKNRDNKSVTSNGTKSSLTISSKSTGNRPAGKFIAPQCVRKRVIVKPMMSNQSYTKEKLKSTNQTNSKSVDKKQYSSTHQLLELQVECKNKDITIQEHEKEIEEMKEEMCKLEVQIEELRTKQIEVEDQHKKDIETMAKLQQEVLDNHDERHQAEADELRSKLLDMSREKEEEISARRIVESELRKRVAELSEKIFHLESEVAKKTESNHITIQTLEARNEVLLSKLKTLEEERNKKIELLEKEKSQLILDVNDLTDNKCELEAKLGKRQNVILELQGQLSTLQCELDELKAEYDKAIEDSVIQTNKLVKSYKQKREESMDRFLKENENLKLQYDKTKITVVELQNNLEEITETNTFLQQELQDVKRLYRDVSQRLTQALEELKIAEQNHEHLLKVHKTEIEDLQKEHCEENLKLRQLLAEAKENYLNEIESLTIAKDKEMADLKKTTSQQIEEETKRMKEHTSKIVENAEAVTRETLAACREESEERVKRAIAECDAKLNGPHINAMIKEATSEIEKEMRLNAEKYEACIEKLKNERVALDDKLALRDAEIAKLHSILQELKLSAETQESFSQSLQIELDKAESELADKRAELRALKDQIRSEAAELVSRRKRFEIVMTENQAAFAAVSEHLAQSNAEVERLQHELKRAEDSLQEHRDVLTSICNNSQMIQNIMKQLDARRQIVNKIEADSISECESIKKIYELKIDEYQRKATKEINRLREQVKKKNSDNLEMKKQLDKMASSLFSTRGLLLGLEQINDEKSIEISRLELDNSKLQEQLKNQKKITEEHNEIISMLPMTHNLTVERANCHTKELSKKQRLVEEKDRCANSKCLLIQKEKEELQAREEKLLQDLEEERVHRQTVETEVKTLSESNDRLKKEYDEINEKYANVLGHQNHKQRMKHVSQLKEKISRLEQELQSKCKMLEQQQQNTTAEKLKTQQKRSQTKGKENVIGGGVSRSSHTTPTSSPHKSLTPLRNRNE